MGLIQTLIAPPSKPKVPPFVPIDTTAEQAAAIAGNQSNLAGIEKLVGDTNSFMGQQWLNATKFGFPNFSSVAGNITNNIEDWTSGTIPQDVQDLIQRNGAVKSLYGGYGGTGMGGNLVARDLGLTSLDLMGRGQDAATKWMAATRVPTMDVSGMFISPQQKIGVSQWNKEFAFNRDWTKNQIKAMPDPFWSALGASFDSMLGSAASAAGSAAGASGGGGGGGGM